MADDRPVLRFLCVFSLSFLSTIHCFSIPPLELCAAANFDVRNLTSKIWKFTAPKGLCLNPKTNTTVSECEITMAFCQSVSKSDSCANSSVCESYPGTVNDTYNLATYAAGRNPFNTSASASGIGFFISYPKGETYTKPDNTTCVLNTVMKFACNATAYWDSESSATVISVPVKPIIQLTLGAKLCTYNFTFDFAGACPSTTPHQPVNQLSAGSVLLLIFFVSGIMYFVLGAFINIARGRTGQGIIPHHQFWAALPVYIMDGIQFTLTCGERRPSQSYESI